MSNFTLRTFNPKNPKDTIEQIQVEQVISHYAKESSYDTVIEKANVSKYLDDPNEDYCAELQEILPDGKCREVSGMPVLGFRRKGDTIEMTTVKPF